MSATFIKRTDDMSRQIEGQMSIFDILRPENDKKLQKTTENVTNLTVFDPYDYLTWCDWCAYQDETKNCTYDEPLGRFCCQGDGFKPKGKLPKPEKKTCRTCSHWRPYNHGWEDYTCGHACFGFGISKSDRADKPACDTYEERTDG